MLETERKTFIDACRELEYENDYFMKTNFDPPIKNRSLSTLAREDGNSLYVSKLHDDIIHEEIFKFYCQSICIAPIGSVELALAYGNRSAFLQHISRHKECIKDIDRALKITAGTNALKVKLLCRKVVCQDALGLSNSKSTLEKAKFWVEKMHDDKNRQKLLKLIEKTESSLHDTKQNKSQEQIDEVFEALSIKEEVNMFDSIAIQHTEKYGRHLVVARDFQPGEIVFKEKLYARVLNLEKAYTNCHNCLNYFWSGIPCNYCNWAMFCSEECKNEAMKNYHDIECSTVTIIRHVGKKCIDYYHMSIRLLIMGLKEAGSIEQLKTHLQSDNECADEQDKMRDSKFKNICNLTSDAEDILIKDQRKLVVLVLMSLKKYSTIFGENSSGNKLKDLLNNDDFIFIGSLVYKLFEIYSINGYALNHESTACKYSDTSTECSQNLCCIRGRGIAQVASFINHSCIPNVRHCFTDDGKIVVFAIRPIEKNSQIFDSYGSTFYQLEYSDRQEYLEKYNFTCTCQACMERWPVVLEKINDFEEQTDPYIKKIASEIYVNIQDVLAAVDNGETNFDQKTVENLSNEVARAINILLQPSTLTCYASDGLSRVLTYFYGYGSQSFGQCQNFSSIPLRFKDK